MKHAKMKERRLAERAVTAVTVAAACVALCAGGTLAYFSAEEHAHNVITTGGVGIELVEWGDLERTQPFEDAEGVMPGESVVKVVEVENTGQAPVWVRVKADVAVELAEGAQAPEGDPTDVVAIDFGTEKWTEKDGWWHYNEILPAGETTSPLFQHVTFDGPGMGNAYQGCEVTVDVLAQAVQSDNNGATALEAAGWPAE